MESIQPAAAYDLLYRCFPIAKSHGLLIYIKYCDNSIHIYFEPTKQLSLSVICGALQSGYCPTGRNRLYALNACSVILAYPWSIYLMTKRDDDGVDEGI